MENASKALIIAGSVLLAMLVIGTLVFMFSSLSNIQQTEADSSTAEKLAEYNRQIELYNKSGLYGSEILSLANLIEDYNVRQAEYKGYTPIILEVYTNSMGSNTTMKTAYSGQNGYLDLIQDFKKLTDDVNDLSNDTLYGESIRELAGMRTEEIVQILRDNGIDVEFSDISDASINNNPQYKSLQEKISEYNSKNSELTQFKRKSFQLPEVEYDAITGRVKSMIFKEVGYIE